MKKRAAILLCAVVAFLAGAVAIAQKNVTLAIKLSRLEGKPQELLLDATSITIDDAAIWSRSADDHSSGDAPAMEFTSGEPQTLSVELFFDTFEERGNVHDKYVQPLEGLVAVDPQLDRPPMVQVTFPRLQPFKGVVTRISTKYTMFLPDGTPVRCTTNLQMKKASSASKKKPPNPCP